MSAGRLNSLQDRLLLRLGTQPAERGPIVAALLRREPAETTSYWLQLVVAIGIATLGLVVGSTAVVIGAMLIAPLMGPIIGVAMGLAAGSPVLVLRSAWRIAMSVGLAIGSAAVITQLVPFHESNSEIAARASPTVLDLVTAAFCAVAGVYASVRRSSDTATTAAGTSIGISLVPPLCASGFGVGTRTWEVASGAALLFLTNLVAIIVVGTVAFVAVGFNRVAVASLEHDALAQGTHLPIASAVVARLARLFESRWGPLFRFLMPFVLLAAVFIPLQRALMEVAWEVRTRSAIAEAISHEPTKVIQTHVRIARHTVDVSVVIVGTNDEATAARTRIEGVVRNTARVTPRIQVLAIPDATALAGLQSALTGANSEALPPLTDPDPPLRRVQTELSATWPAAHAGELLALDVGDDPAGPLRVRVTHLGPALSPDAAETSRLALAERLGRSIELVDVDVPRDALTRNGGDAALVARLASALAATKSLETVSVCVHRPTRDTAVSPDAAPSFESTVEELLATHPRVAYVEAEEWSIVFVVGTCPAIADGGVPDGMPEEHQLDDAAH